MLAVCCLFFETTQAQTEKGSDRSIFRNAGGLTIGGSQQTWTLKDSNGTKVGTLLQQSAPVTVSYPLANRLLMSVTNSAVYSSYDTTTTFTIVDTRVSLSYVFPGEKFWLTGGVSVPTGLTQLASDELTMTSLLGQTAFAYRVPTFGQGLSGNASLVYAASLTRRMVLGVGLSYNYKGAFKPVKAVDTKYDAGDEISLNVGYDFITYGKSARFSADVTATYFFADKLGENEVFHAGPRAIATLLYTLRTEKLNHTVQLRSRYRMKNNFINSNKKYDASFQAEGQYSLGLMTFDGLYASLVAEGKFYTPDQVPTGISYIETGNAKVVSGGADLTFVTFGWVMPTVGFRYGSGVLTIAGEEFDVTGLDANLSVRIAF